MRRLDILLVGVVVATAFSNTYAQRPTQKAIREWIDELHDDQLRAAAAKRLTEAGRDAIPFVALQSADLELAVCRLGILKALSASEDPATCETAQAAIKKMVKKDYRLVPFLHGAATEARIKAIENLKKHGARMLMLGDSDRFQILIDANWTGGDDALLGLREFKIDSLQFLPRFELELELPFPPIPEHPPITADGLVHLKHLGDIRSLTLPGCATDESLRFLKGLTGLRELGINFAGRDVTGITGTGFIHLADLKIEILDLSWSRMSSGNLKHVAQLKGLKNLTAPCSMTDDGLRSLGGLTKLERLTIRRGEVTDAGLDYVTKLPSLRALILSDCKVTPEGVAKLRKSHPNLLVIYR